MRRARLGPGGEPLLWFGVLGAPAAWALTHLAGVELSQASCMEAARGGGWNLHFDAWTIAVFATMAAIAVAAEVAAVLTFRATRDASSAPPRGRIHFLAIIGMTIGPLFLAMILMGGLGAVLLERCQQG
ncbi:MAG TPA: hypothetical protein VN635_11000 [Conexibacter sp.]|nr:hypothetical protein [Conexibacter sp.]